MIQLLFALLAAEAALALSLLLRTPARRLVLLAVDRAKRGRGPVMAKTVAGTMLLVLASSGYSIGKIRCRADELGQLTLTDQVLASRHLLEALLMGYSLFLGLIIYLLQPYISGAEEVRGYQKKNASLKEQVKTAETNPVALQRAIGYARTTRR